jgi:hypothetical protein
MIPLAIFAGAAVFIKAKNLSIRINELLEIEQAYYKLLEEKETTAKQLETTSRNIL